MPMPHPSPVFLSITIEPLFPKVKIKFLFFLTSPKSIQSTKKTTTIIRRHHQKKKERNPLNKPFFKINFTFIFLISHFFVFFFNIFLFNLKKKPKF
uniref:Ovule protein n=1 Tax=Panagrolaimus sp. ES5 TaxID=591445 RepID=A0AC34FAD7_9BILA